MKKYLKFLVVSILGVCLFVIVAFGAITKYYSNHFPVNTWINGVYCTGKTIEEVNRELQELQEASVVTITDANRAYWEIHMQEAKIVPDYQESLKEFLQSNADVFWVEWLQEPVDIQIKADRYLFDEEHLKSVLGKLDFVEQEMKRENGVEIRWEDGNYFLYDGNENRLDVDKLYASLVQALQNGDTTISLAEIDVFGNLTDTEEDKAQRDLWKKLNDFADCKLVYDMGAEQIEFTPQIVLSFLKKEQVADSTNANLTERTEFLLDEKGELVLDEVAVNAWVDSLLEQYNTCGETIEFHATRGDIVEVSYVKYGTELDGDAEKEYLWNALSTKRTQVEIHTPTYIQEGFVRGIDDIGGTYIEIDMTEQKMYYYKDAELMLETDVVTGDVQDDMETPEGINYVYNKQRNRTLRGPGYASFVKYWMPVIGGVGIHDASWRSKFGGEIYLKNGSHGCINTPSDIMDDFYEAVEIGTPVIMFY